MPVIRRVPIDTYPESTAFLLRDGEDYSSEQFQALRRIRVWRGKKEILATLSLVDDPSIVSGGEIGLGEQAFRRLGLKAGTRVQFEQAPPLKSLESVRRKIEGHTLGDKQIDGIISEIAEYRYSPMEIAAFLVACAAFTSTEETLYLAKAMVAAGRRLKWDSQIVVDKHCVGGIPGNRTSMIVVPIVAAHGLICPKTSSRAITSPSGTADTMEVLASVDLDEKQMRRIVAKHHAVLAWGGRIGLSPADDILISVERPLRLDTPEQMVASILSKKAAAGSTHLVIDMPIGPTAKVRSKAEAIRLRKLFEIVAAEMGIVVDVVFTDGSTPIGRGIGPVLEARDVMAVLRRDENAPRDLRDRSILLAGRVLEFDPALRGGQGRARAEYLLDSGAALQAMENLIAAQGPAQPSRLGRHCFTVRAPTAGTVRQIDCERIARIARLAGAPMDKGAGIDLKCSLGDPLTKGTAMYVVYANSRTGLGFARSLADERSGFAIAP